MQTYPNRAVFRDNGWTVSGQNKSFVILERDKKILVDIAKKVYKGSALTDKQYEVVQTYFGQQICFQFKLRDIDIQNSANILRKPNTTFRQNKIHKNRRRWRLPKTAFGVDTHPLKIIVIRFVQLDVKQISKRY